LQKAETKMKALTLALILTSIMTHTTFGMSVLNAAPPARRPSGRMEKHSPGGRWYFAATGHAVYCYGPVMTVPQANGDLQKVATFCGDGSAVVPLKD
jgi:hypothetical protein